MGGAAPERYEAWLTDGGAALFPASQRETHAAHPAMGLVRCLYAFEAATWEEACAIHHLRMGFEPYVPAGEAAPCPRCEAWYYPEGSGACWRCGPGVASR